MKALSIVTVNYRSWTHLAQCLDSVKDQLDGNLEMIVVDNDSDDGKADAFTAAYPWVRFILQDLNGGFSQACNRGASEATGRWLLFLNPDTVLEPGVLARLLERAEREPSWKLIGIRQYDESGNDWHQHGNFPKWWTIWPMMRTVERFMRGSTNSRRYINKARVSHPDWISGCFILIRRDDFRELGGWDPRFWMYSEDIDLCRRAADRGWDRVMYNELSCMHMRGGSSRINMETAAVCKSEVIRSQHRYIDKYFSGAGKWIAKGTLVWQTVLRIAISAPFSQVNRKMAANLLGNKAQPREGFGAGTGVREIREA